ncbi:hypothetical protein EXIGLDRAFT_478096 [Exidia glandulosa HHB12029]|uniref:Secreted protein n=1 Tax=Exidia glandulosa HHB12029 TaxID=1314781 RepID=A0A166NID7_EXIGL|nr:hypothetical protein EXIGLDRAFT_478096 [Exidia glandulosa HHB12029]
MILSCSFTVVIAACATYIAHAGRGPPTLAPAHKCSVVAQCTGDRHVDASALSIGLRDNQGPAKTQAISTHVILQLRDTYGSFRAPCEDLRG